LIAHDKHEHDLVMIKVSLTFYSYFLTDSHFFKTQNMFELPRRWRNWWEWTV